MAIRWDTVEAKWRMNNQPKIGAEKSRNATERMWMLVEISCQSEGGVESFT
jgi:hypothetical protein